MSAVASFTLRTPALTCEPLGFVGMALQPQAGNKGFIATHDYHDEEIRSSRHRSIRHRWHDLFLFSMSGLGYQVQELDQEVIHVNALSHNQA